VSEPHAIRNHASFIWSVADKLRGVYKQSEYGRVILPLVVLRRLDCVLEPTKAAVLERAAGLKGRVENVEPVLCAVSGEHRERVHALFADADLQVEFTGVAGEPAEELIEAAEQRQAELIVVGTREPGFLERLLGGSVSQDVARRARCDVLIVHPAD
jgi:nucleotide-binding universal stress UspA family protein